MTHKVHPLGFRLGITKDWKSRWFDFKNYAMNTQQDFIIREYIDNKFKGAGVESIEIERFSNRMSIIIYTSRPGILIGRGGSGMEEIKRDLAKKLVALKNKKDRFLTQIKKGNPANSQKLGELRIEVREIRDTEKYAKLVALSVAEQLERRMAFRRVIKRTLDRVIAHKEVQGVKILVKGRLNGADMARSEFVKNGNLPLQTLRADIDFAHVNAATTFGVIGVKVWIYRGEKLE